MANLQFELAMMYVSQGRIQDLRKAGGGNYNYNY